MFNIFESIALNCIEQFLDMGLGPTKVLTFNISFWYVKEVESLYKIVPTQPSKTYLTKVKSI